MKLGRHVFLLSCALLALAFRTTRLHAQVPSGDRAADAAATEQRVNDLLARLTLDEKIELLSGDTPFRTHGIARLGIPSLQMADGPVGAHIPAPTIAYAAGIGLAASWDEALAREVGVQLGRDSRSRGAAFLLGPGVNIYRAPMNGRNFEYFGEDPFLASRIAVGYIRGVQSQGVSATVKHFLGNNSEYLRHDTDSVIDPRALHEIYEPVFEAAVKEAHVGAIMDAYNITNGQHMTQNGPLNVELVKNQWHFRGLIMSDWISVYDTAGAANGGLDLEMPFGVYFSPEKLKPLLGNGTVTQATLDSKVRRLLRVAVEFGWLDHPVLDASIPRYNLQGRAASLQGALEGTVLLQNTDHLLPLVHANTRTLAVIGPTAVQTVTTGGGSGEVVSFASTNLLTGISNAMGEDRTTLYARGLYSVDQLARLTHFTTTAQGGTAGLTHEVFAETDLAGTPVSTAVEPAILVPPGTRRLPEEQELNALQMHKSSSPYRTAPGSARWTGYFTPEKAGEYAVYVQTDARYRLLIDGDTVFDSTVLPKYVLNQTTRRLTREPHKVVLEVTSQALGSVSGLRMGIADLSTIVDPEALEMAKKADAVVLAVGFNNQSETEGGDRSFELPVGQNQLIEAIAAVNPNTVVAITSGGSADVLPWKSKVRGIFATWYPGEEGGTAFAKLLFGDVNPSGHLPISWERTLTDNPSVKNYYPDPGTDRVVYREGIFVGYRGYEHTGTPPLFPFGFGLSYTTFQLDHLTAQVMEDGRVRATFNVTNTGTRAGATVAQVYVGEAHPAVERPRKELKGFARVMLAPGETRKATVELTPRSFSYFDPKTGTWIADAGSYTLSLGQSSGAAEAATSVELKHAITTPVEQ